MISPLCRCVAARKMSDFSLGTRERHGLVADDGRQETTIRFDS